MTPPITPERYQRIGQLFDEALERAPEDRAAFLDQVSEDDAGLRSEVEKLLAHHSESLEFLSRPVTERRIRIARLPVPQRQCSAAQVRVQQRILHSIITRIRAAEFD